MAKCVVCSYQNAVEDCKKYNNPSTREAVAITTRKLYKASVKQPHKFCAVHKPSSSASDSSNPS